MDLRAAPTLVPVCRVVLVWVLSFVASGMTVAVAEAQTSGPQSASPEDVAQARALFAEGVAQLQNEQWEGACQSLSRSVALVETAQTHFNLAICSEHTARLVEQAEHLRAFVRLAGPEVEPERVASARAAITQIEARLSRLVLRVSGVIEGASVEVNGRAVPPAAWSSARPLSPGRVTIRATAPGAQTFEQEITLGERETREVEILLVRAVSGVVDWDGSVVAQDPSTERARRDTSTGPDAAVATHDDTGLAWGLGLSLTALLGAGAAVLVWWFGFESQSLRPHLFEQELAVGAGVTIMTLVVDR